MRFLVFKCDLDVYVRFKENLITITTVVLNQGKLADLCTDQYCEKGGLGFEFRVPHNTASCSAQVSVNSESRS